MQKKKRHSKKKDTAPCHGAKTQANTEQMQASMEQLDKDGSWPKVRQHNDDNMDEIVSLALPQI